MQNVIEQSSNQTLLAAQVMLIDLLALAWIKVTETSLLRNYTDIEMIEKKRNK